MAIGFTTVVGLALYLASYQLISKYQREGMKDPTTNVFRVVGMLVTFYTIFVGLVLYLIIALSDPFQGIGVEPTNFKILIEKLRSASG